MVLKALIVGIWGSASLASEVCEIPCMLTSVHSDGTYSMQSASGEGRSTPVIDATIVGVLGQDIDGDGTPERVVIDDRESAFGSVTAQCWTAHECVGIRSHTAAWNNFGQV